MKIRLFFQLYQKWFYRLILLFIITILAVIGLWYWQKQNLESSIFVDYKSQQLLINNKKIILYLADDSKKSTLGLSIVAKLPEYKGMLFEFDEKSYHSFWMKNMKIDLDIIFLVDGQITDILENVTPEAYPQTFSSSVPTNQVIELNAGETKKLGIKVGDRLRLNDKLPYAEP